MNKEEVDYWLRLFSNNNQSFMSKDGKKITLFKVFQELKELHYLLKIKNDYINELEAYKYNIDRDYLRLQQENEKLKEVVNKAIDYMKNNATSNSFDKEKNMFRREEDLLKILKEVEQMNKDFYNELPGMVCLILDELIEKYKNEEWFENAWNEYREHILKSDMDDMKMPGAIFNKYLGDSNE